VLLHRTDELTDQGSAGSSKITTVCWHPLRNVGIRPTFLESMHVAQCFPRGIRSRRADCGTVRPDLAVPLSSPTA